MHIEQIIGVHNGYITFLVGINILFIFYALFILQNTCIM